MELKFFCHAPVEVNRAELYGTVVATLTLGRLVRFCLLKVIKCFVEYVFVVADLD